MTQKRISVVSIKQRHISTCARPEYLIPPAGREEADDLRPAQPDLKLASGDLLAVPEQDYCYGHGTILLRARNVLADSGELLRLRWVPLVGEELDPDTGGTATPAAIFWFVSHPLSPQSVRVAGHRQRLAGLR